MEKYVDRKALGKAIRTQRCRQKMTQSELEEKAGLCAHYLSRIERGAGSCSLDILMKIADVLQVSPNVLLPGTQTNDSLLGEDVLLIQQVSVLSARQKKLIRLILDLIDEKSSTEKK